MVQDLRPEIVLLALEHRGNLPLLVGRQRDLEHDDGDLVAAVLEPGPAARHHVQPILEELDGRVRAHRDRHLPLLRALQCAIRV